LSKFLKVLIWLGFFLLASLLFKKNIHYTIQGPIGTANFFNTLVSIIFVILSFKLLLWARINNKAEILIAYFLYSWFPFLMFFYFVPKIGVNLLQIGFISTGPLQGFGMISWTPIIPLMLLFLVYCVSK